MAKAYWVSCYRSILDTDKMAAYAQLAGPAVLAAGGRYVARGLAAQAYEAGVIQRVVIVEFDSLDAAVATHDGAAYQAAFKVLDGGAVRDFRIVEAAK